ncbi:MAG: hypothetical protein AB1714_06310 [Acidobacteriota bacterium]
MRRRSRSLRDRVIRDWLEAITFYDCRTVGVDIDPRPGGRYHVVLRYEVRKYRADAQGRENEVAIDDLIEFGLFAADGRPLAMERRCVRSAYGTWECIVAEKPARAGIDPRLYLVDKNIDDNVWVLEQADSDGPSWMD